MKDPLVSVITPTWNRPEGLRKACEMVDAQSYTNWEHIIVHDGPVDPIKARDTEKRKGYCSDHNHDDLGISPLNFGLTVAKGELFIRLSDDDEITPGHVKDLVALFEKDEGLGFAFCFGQVWNKETGEQIGLINRHVPTCQYMDVGQFMFRRDIDARFGPWIYTNYAYDYWRVRQMMEAGVRFQNNGKFTFKFWMGKMKGAA